MKENQASRIGLMSSPQTADNSNGGGFLATAPPVPPMWGIGRIKSENEKDSSIVSGSTLHHILPITPTEECIAPLRRRPPLMGLSAELTETSPQIGRAHV